MNDSSAGSLRAARRRADQLDLDYGHFAGQRRWSDQQLRDAVADASSWSAVVTALGGTPDGGSLSRCRTRALRLALSVSHLEAARTVVKPSLPASVARLRSAAPMLAACWFTLRGYNVSWPLEPQRYDLLVERGDDLRRVQVKTTMSLAQTDRPVAVTNACDRGRAVYSGDEIDCFFLVDRDLNAYVIPLGEVQGRQRLSLRAHEAFRVMTKGDLLGAPRRVALCPCGRDDSTLALLAHLYRDLDG